MVGPGGLPARNRTESLESVGKSHIMTTKRECVLDEGVDDGKIPLPALFGEHPLYHGFTSCGHIVLSTYRLFYYCNETYNVVPRGLIDKVEAREATLVILCKNGKMESCSMVSKEDCIKWRDRIIKELSTPPPLADTFAFTYFVTSDEAPIDRSKPQWLHNKGYRWKFTEEIKRLKIDLKNVWRITDINEDFSFCPSYPRELIIPRQFSDDQLKLSARFRTKSRFPSLVWRNKHNGAALLRCSQPTMGWGKRCEADEQLVTAVMEACKTTSLKIVDARSWLAAAGNCVWNNGGYECDAYYDKCSIVYQNLPNIHAVRASFLAVRELCTKDSTSWFASLENTKWLSNLLLLFEAAEVCVASLTHQTNPEPVLVHCSDGWDRTPQIVALTQIIIDPFYRTLKGFEHLVKREWIAFGHKFADRCGNYVNVAAAAEEVSPIFLQWLDAVHQLMLLYPAAFEFNEAYLLKLCEHVYSGMFGNFMHNTLKARKEELFMADTTSIWGYLQHHEPLFINKLYNAHSKQVLSRVWHLRDLKLWTNVYLSPHTPNSGLPSAHTMDISVTSMSRRTMSDSDLSIASTDEHLTGSQSNLQLSSKLSSSIMSGLSTGSAGDGGRSRHGSRASLREQPSSSSLNINHTPPIHIPPPPNRRKSNDESALCLPLRLGDDGLMKVVVPIDKCLNRFVSAQESRIKQLESEVEKLKLLLSENNGAFHSQIPTPNENEAADSTGSGGESSDSWENVEDKDKDGVTLWVPDHMVNFCSGCTVPFRVFRRKHHCRNCGLIFCVNCANNFVPIPEQYLYEASRVCKICSSRLSKSKEGGDMEPNTPIPYSHTAPLWNSVENTGSSPSEPVAIPSLQTRPCLHQEATNSPATSDSGLLFKTCSQDSINTSEAYHMPSRAKCL